MTGAIVAQPTNKVAEVSITTLPEGKLCGFFDQKIRADTPEEYIRQNIERRLVLKLGFQPEQIAVEFAIAMGIAKKRVDLVIFKQGEQHTQANAWIMIECKRDSIEPRNKKDGVEQLKSYLAACSNAEWGMWTNGKYKEVF